MRRAVKISAWTAGALLLFIVLLVGAVLVTGNTDSGRRLIERMTARLSDGHVQLSHLAGPFPAALDLGRLQLSDDRGVWLVAESISLRWSPWALLARHVQVESLSVGRLDIERRPVTKPDTKSSSPSIPRSDLEHLSIGTLQLGAELAGMPASLVVHGSAHFRSLQDANARVSAQRTGGSGDYELQLHFDPVRIDATLKVQEPANGPLENILTVPGLGDLSLLAKVSGARTAEKLELTLAAGDLRGRVQGTVNLAEPAADLDYAFDAPAMTPSPSISWQSLALHGRWHGPLKQAVADGSLQARRLQLPGGLAVDSLSADLTASGGLVSGRAVIDGMTIPGPEPTLLQGSPLTVDASMHVNDEGRPLQLAATHRLFSLTGRATTAGQQSAQLELRLLDLAPLAAIAGQKVRGSASIKAQLARDGSATRVTADATGAIDGGAAIWAGLLRDGNTGLQVSATVTDKEVKLQKLSLTGRALSLGLSGSVTRSDTPVLAAQLDLSLPDLARLSPALAGTLKLSGNLNGPTGNLAAVVQVTSALSVRGSPRGTVTASVRANGLPKAPRGNVEARGDLDGAPLLLDVSLVGAKGETVHAIIHHADWKSAHAEGDLLTGADFEQTSGNVRLRMGQLADLNRLLGSALQGSVSGELSMRPVGGHSHAQLRLDARDVQAGGLTSDLQLAASGTKDALSLRLAAKSPAVAGAPAEVTANALLNLGAHELRLEGAEGSYHEQTVRLSSPAVLSFADGFSIQGLKLQAQQAVLEVNGRFSPTLDVRASLQDLKPELINAFMPGLLANGTIQARANVHGSFDLPQGELHAEAIGMRSANDAARGLPAVDVRATAQLQGNTALLDSELTAGKASQLTLKGHAPLARDGALDLKLLGNVDVGLLNPLLEPHGRHVSGELKIDTTVTGAAAAPEIGGAIRIANGSLRDYIQGTNLTEITAEVTGSHGLLRIEKFTARAPPGDLSVTGTVGVLQPGVPVDLKLVARNAQPIASNIVTANLNSEITVKGTARERLDVAGKIDVNRADVTIPSGLPPNVAVLDVRRPGKAPPPPSEKPLVIGLNISVDAPRQILVKGRGLDAELGGQIRVRGTTDSPQVSGGFELLRGTFALASSNLTFSQGSVTFNGAGLVKKIDPTLDFTAQTTVVDVTATVRITGLADAPKIELSSTPDLPQDEILARLLFGESAAQLTALQVVQIGAALAKLSGGGGGFNPLEKIQKTLGLDRLSVAGGSSGTTPGAQNTGASIEAGRYVSSRVFVGVRESTTGASQLQVDVDLAKRVKLQARLGNGTATAQGTTPENDPGSSVGVAYQFEY